MHTGLRILGGYVGMGQPFAGTSTAGEQHAGHEFVLNVEVTIVSALRRSDVAFKPNRFPAGGFGDWYCLIASFSIGSGRASQYDQLPILSRGNTLDLPRVPNLSP